MSRWQRWRAGLRYRAARAASLALRGLSSLRQHGLRQTWQRARDYLRRRQPAPAPLRWQPGPVALAELRFEPVPAPRASIIIPIHGQLDYTLHCLQALMTSGDACPFEVIVVDDASPDASAATLAPIPGLRLHRLPENLGFIGACNAGAALARGEFLVFLNNDTAVQPGWLDALLATFERHPDTGLAGSKLVYPDGRLQEAGGLLFADGSARNRGRFEDPADPRFNHVRETGYCSGAAIALPRELFARLGGFDGHYAPAYYEDADLAMRVREAGRRVRYQPASVVVHFEGITGGTDVRQGVKAYQVRNQQRFFERWQARLAADFPPPGTPDDVAARTRRRQVLVLDAVTPMPDRDAGSVRMAEILRLLRELDCEVSFFAENGAHHGAYSEALQQAGVAVWWQPWLSPLPGWLERHGDRFDLVIASRHYVLAPVLPLLRQYAPRATVVFDTVDLHFLREQRQAEASGDPAQAQAAARTRRAEMALIAEADRTWVVSDHEQRLLATLTPTATVELLATIYRVCEDTPDFAARQDLVFVGGFRHPPNVDAALWLGTDIFPALRRRRPELRLHLVGADAPESVRALSAQEGVSVHGHVPDLEALLDTCRIGLAPLRFGAGVKGKINQGLARGLPMVATSCAIEGMHLAPGRDIAVADEAEAFVAEVLALYEDPDRWRAQRAGGLDNTRRHFAPERAREVLAALLDGLPARSS